MSTLMGAVELLRGRDRLPHSGPVSVRELLNRFHPAPAGSMRALLFAMFGLVSEKRPWSVILCRFKGEAADAAVETPIEQFYREAFAPGSGGFVEYWRDVSLGSVDVTGSQVFGWVEVDIPRSAAGGGPPAGPGRAGLVDAAIRAAQAAGFDPLAGFHSQIAVYTENWSNDDPARPAGTPTWQNDDPLKPWWGTWIDGSADGRGKVTLTPPHDGNITAHEMGHGFGMGHDVGPGLTTASDYSDPCCIMSQNGPFVQPRWQRNFGPSLCVPHLIQKNWMYPRRLYRDPGTWQNDPNGITLPLAPLSRPIARANLGIVLPISINGASWEYHLQYGIPSDWDQGVPGAPYLFIRRFVSTAGEQRPAYLGVVQITQPVGVSQSFVEPQGNTRFTVELTALRGPILKVTAKKL